MSPGGGGVAGVQAEGQGGGVLGEIGRGLLAWALVGARLLLRRYGKATS